jgi:hypothetical protein
MEHYADEILEYTAESRGQVRQHEYLDNLETRRLASPDPLDPPFLDFISPKSTVISLIEHQTTSMDTLRSLSFHKMLLPSSSSNPEDEILYLTGLKGLFALQSFIWIYLHTFIPTLVSAPSSDLNVPGPLYQVILRKALSVFFWNENLIYSAFILLSARCISIPFLYNSTGAQVAGSQFRRSIRLLFPAAVSLAIVYIAWSCMSPAYLSHYVEKSGNSLLETPYQLPNALAYFNSVFNLFWTTNNYFTQAASLAFPTQTLWILSVIFQQSYTVYMTMVIIPYTRPSWRVKALLIFILSAFWVQSWAWFSITGLLISDMVHNMDFKSKARAGIPIFKLHLILPTWAACGVIMAAGLILQYLYTAWRPEYQNVLLEGHAGLYYSGGLNYKYDIHQPQARDDNYLILVGLLVLVETYEVLQWVLGSKVLVYLGRRALSEFSFIVDNTRSRKGLMWRSGWFLVQSILAYTAGIKLWLHLTEIQGMRIPTANFICLVLLLPATIVSGEVFYRLVDRPSQLLAREAYRWIKT